MKKFGILSILACGLLASACTSPSDSGKEAEDREEDQTQISDAPKTLEKKDVSYALGYNVGDVLQKTDDDLNVDDLIQGLKEGFNRSDSPRMSEDQIRNTLVMYNLEISAAMKEKQEKLYQENLEKGKEFIAKYSKGPDVKENESGFYYKVIEEGSGPVPKETDTVSVEYTGKKIDGTVFFSTSSTGQPAEFPMSNVIPGWQAALKEMPVGSTWEIVLPAELGYGNRTVSDVIGPGETLIFKMTLKEIVEKKSLEEEETKDTTE